MNGEELKATLGGLLDRQEWFNIFCTDAVNEVTEVKVIGGFTFNFHRDENFNRTVTHEFSEVIQDYEERRQVEDLTRILEEIIAERTTQ